MASSQPPWAYAQNLAFVVFFMIAFALMKGPKTMEYFGLIMFAVVYLVYSVSLLRDIMNFFMAGGLNPEAKLKLWIIFFSIALSIASAVMLSLTLLNLQATFAKADSAIRLSPTNREKLDTLETIFITVVVFLGVMSTSIYTTPDSLYTFIYDSLKNASSGLSLIIEVAAPFICFGVGSALYERMRLLCDNDEIKTFQSSFRTTYWLLFLLVLLFLGRRLMEWVVFPFLRIKNPNNPLINPSVLLFKDLIKLDTFLGLTMLVLAIMAMVLGWGFYSEFNSGEIAAYWLMVICIILLFFRNRIMTVISTFGGAAFMTNLTNLFGDLLAWDTFLDVAKWILTILAVVYAGISIQDYMNLNPLNACFKHDLQNLYITFITFLFLLFGLTVISPYRLTEILTKLIRYVVPPTLLALTAYLVYTTNNLAYLSTNGRVL